MNQGNWMWPSFTTKDLQLLPSNNNLSQNRVLRIADQENSKCDASFDQDDHI